MANRPFRNVRIDDDAAEAVRNACVDAANMNAGLREVLGMPPSRCTNWKAGVYGVDAEVFAALDAEARAAGASINAVVRRRIGMAADGTHHGRPRMPAEGVAP